MSHFRMLETSEWMTILGSFAFFWAVDLLSRRVWPSLLPDELFKSPKSARILGRHTMDVVAASYFVYLAQMAEADPQLQALWQMTPMQRMYTPNPTVALLALVQISYQLKNLIDSYMCGDGVVFYVHHFMTGLLCAFGCFPFLHAYAPFYIGHTEISTVLLCILANFDDDHGVAGLGDLFPKTKVVIGGLFAIVFISIRCIYWPYMAYFLWGDLFAILQEGPHSHVAVIYTFTVNVALTALQYYWLLEIIATGKKELGAVFRSGISKEE